MPLSLLSTMILSFGYTYDLMWSVKNAEGILESLPTWLSPFPLHKDISLDLRQLCTQSESHCSKMSQMSLNIYHSIDI